MARRKAEARRPEPADLPAPGTAEAEVARREADALRATARELKEIAPEDRRYW